MQYPYHPLGRGFEYFYGFCSGHWGHYYNALMERNGELVKGKGFCVDDFTTEAMNFIDRAVKDEVSHSSLMFPTIPRIVQCRCPTAGGINSRIRILTK